MFLLYIIIPFLVKYLEAGCRVVIFKVSCYQIKRIRLFLIGTMNSLGVNMFSLWVFRPELLATFKLRSSIHKNSIHLKLCWRGAPWWAYFWNLNLVWWSMCHLDGVLHYIILSELCSNGRPKLHTDCSVGWSHRANTASPWLGSECWKLQDYYKVQLKSKRIWVLLLNDNINHSGLSTGDFKIRTYYQSVLVDQNENFGSVGFAPQYTSHICK